MKKATSHRATLVRLENLEPRVLLSGISYGNADFSGTWGIQGVHEAGSLVMDGQGNITTSPVTLEDGTAETVTGTYDVSSTGVVTAQLDFSDGTTRDEVGAINTTKDLVVLNSATIPSPVTNDADLIVLVKHITGNFTGYGPAGTRPLVGIWGHGSVTVDGAGNITAGSIVGPGKPGKITGGSYTISPDGIATITVQTNSSTEASYLGAINDSKDVVAIDDATLESQSSNHANLVLLFGQSGTFSDADAIGAWTLADSEASGILTFNGKGGLSGSGTDPTGDAVTFSGAYNVAANGTMTLHAVASDGHVENMTGAMNSSKNFMAFGPTSPTKNNEELVTLISSESYNAPGVTVSVAGGTLKITGDASDNHISILQTGTGAYTITGLDGTQVKLPAGAGIGDSQSVSGATKDISIDMSVGANKAGFAGNDTVELAGNLQAGDGVTRGSITYKGGAGNDQVFLGGTAATATVTFNANPVEGDTVQMTYPVSLAQTLEFVNDLNDTLSDPSNLPVLIGATASDTMVNFLGAVNEHLIGLVPSDPSVGGASCQLMAFPGSAFNHETIVVSSANITASAFIGGTDYSLDVQNVTATLGDGGNLLTLGTSTNMDNYPSTILGNLSVTGGKGADIVTPIDTTIHGNLTANLGAGDNTLDIVSTPVGGNLNYTGLGGADNIRMSTGEVDGTLTANMGAAGANSNGIFAEWANINGAVTYTASGTGDNDLDFSSATLAKKFSVTTGAGDDTVQLNGANITGNTTLNVGSGANDVTSADAAGAGGLIESGALSVTGGAGDDTVDLSGAQVTGNVTTTLGGGDNSFLSTGSTAATFGGNVNFTTTDKGDNQFVIVGGGNANSIAGGLTVNTGAGDDTVNVTTNVGGNLSINTGTSPDGDLIDCSDGVVTGTATIKSGNAGNIYGGLQIWGMTFKHATTLGTGTGTNSVDIEGCDFGSLGGAFNLTSGAGADTVKIAASTGFAPTIFRTAVNVSLGAGNDTLQIGASSDTADGGTGDANTHASFLSSVSHPVFNGGAGASKITYLNEGGNNALPIANVFTLTPVIAKFSKS